MNKCTNCGYTAEDSFKFCPECGGKMEAEAPVYTAPAAPAPVARPSIAKGIVGMAFSIEAFLSVIALLFFYIASPGMRMGMFVLLSIFFVVINLPFCIVGLVLSKDPTDGQNTPVVCRLGKIFGILALVFTIVGPILFPILTIFFARSGV